MNVTDLFCGCGGLSLGFVKAGFAIVSAYDNWPVALETYSRNFKHKAELLDLKNVEDSIKIIKKDAPDMIIGGHLVRTSHPLASAMKITVVGT